MTIIRRKFCLGSINIYGVSFHVKKYPLYNYHKGYYKDIPSFEKNKERTKKTSGVCETLMPPQTPFSFSKTVTFIFDLDLDR